MNEQTRVMIDMITSTHPDRDYLNDDGEPHRCFDCDGLIYWTDLKEWTHHRHNRTCWSSRNEHDKHFTTVRAEHD
jgi:hypothetical protein